MLSCAAIQKLERYGQLGLKRNNVEDFVASSLKDPKRANIYALTHTQTWQECLDAIHRSSRKGAATAAATPAGTTSAPVMISDALMYAASFTTSLVTQHVFLRLQRQLTGDAVAASGEGTSTPHSSGSEVFVAASGQGTTVEAAAAAAPELVALLKRVMVQVAREANRGGLAHANADGEVRVKAGGVRIAESKELTQALTHLVSNLSTMLLYTLSVQLNCLGGSTFPTAGESEAESKAMACIWHDGLVLFAAATRLLRRVAATQHSLSHRNSGNNSKKDASEEPLFTVRSTNALVKQFLAKHQQSKEGDKAATVTARLPPVERHELFQTFPLLRVVLSYLNIMAVSSVSGAPMASGFAFLENYSMLQKLSLVHAVLPDVSRLRATALRAAPPSADEQVDSGTLAFLELNVQQLLRDLLSSSACNKATRYVIYFRGDDLKLMQSKITQPSQYALHSFATTPPVEPSLVDAFVAAMARVQQASPAESRVDKKVAARAQGTSGAAVHLWSEQQRCFYAFLFTQWIVTAPFFFEAFCSDPSWTAFAQEQRRTALLRQAQERRHKREDKRKSKRSKREGSVGSGTSSVGGSASETASLVDGENDDSDAASTLSSATDGQLSLAPSLKTSRSMLSMESRASLLSTLSKQSAATYMSFLSVLKPTGDDAQAAEPAKFHESADGNTNLPLILLEELVLGLHRFMEAVPASNLDGVGLRSLCWQSIGRLFTFIQDSISMEGSLLSASSGPSADDDAQATKKSGKLGAPLTIFNLGTDLRYNHGLGYESLGLLFAKVIAPQFEVAQEAAALNGGGAADGAEDEEAALPRAPPTLGRAFVLKTDPASAKRCVEAALSRCLAAYEEVAPQVVDMNLPIILRIAARTAADAAHTAVAPAVAEAHESASAPASVVVLYHFLAGIILRLGRCNQLPTLLSALVASVDAKGKAPNTTVAAQDEAEEEEEDVAALQIVFSHPLCRAALIEASGLSMDPENLLGQLLTYVSVWSLGEADEEEGQGSHSATDKTQDPPHVLFVLKLAATVLEGLQPTSMTSSAVLERSTELELLLSAFVQQHLFHTTPGASTVNGVGDAEKPGRLFRAGVLRPKLRRQLWLHALYAIYRCRAVTTACLRDLGLQNVKDYLSLLNETLWQVDRCAGALLVSADGEDAEETAFSVTGGFGVPDVAAQMSATTHTTLAPFLHVQTLLPALALQRLSLARSVSTVLDCPVAPAEDAKALAHAVLDAIATCCADVGTEAPAGAAASLASLLFSFVNDISEEEWASLVQFAKRKCVRATLVALLKRTFTSPAHSGLQQQPQGSQRQKPAYVAPVWLTRCLHCAGGPVLRAMTDMFLTYSTEEVVATASDENGKEPELLAMLAALSQTYSIVGHVPFWPLLVERASTWLDAIVARHVTAARSSSVVAALLSFLHGTLRYEWKSGEVLRKTLLLTEGTTQERRQQQQQQQGQRKGLSRTYLQDVGVLAKEEANEEGDGVDNYLDDELTAFADELHAFTHRVFSRHFAESLLSLGEGDTAAGVLGFLYHTATLTSRVACREGRYYAAGVKRRDCTAAVFLRTVAECLHARVTAAPAGAGTSKTPDAHACLLGFLHTLGQLPAGDTALLPGLPLKSSKHKKKKDDTPAVNEMVSFVNGTQAVWRSTLCFYIASATTTGDVAVVAPVHLRCLTALYARLLASFARGFSRDTSAASAANAFAHLLLHGEEESDGCGATTPELHEALHGVFAPLGSAAVGDAAKRSAEAAMRRAVSLLSSMLTPKSSSQREGKSQVDCTPGMVALWVLYNLFGESIAHGSTKQATAVAASTVDERRATAAAVVSSVLAFLPELLRHEEKAERDRVLDSVVAHVREVSLPLARKQHGRIGESAFRAVSPVSLSTSTSSMAFYEQALDASVSAFTLLSADAAPPLLSAYLHALLSQCLSSAAALGEAGRSRSASASDGFALLSVAARALFRLARAPGVKVHALVKPHVAAALSLSTTAPFLLAPVSSLPQRGPANAPAAAGVYEVLLTVLQIPAVAAAMEANDASLDVAWAFVALLLEESNNTSKRGGHHHHHRWRDQDVARGVTTAAVHQAKDALKARPLSGKGGSGGAAAAGREAGFVLPQREMLAMLALLTRTWLPRRVLWRRVGQLPPLINALFEAVLIGVRDGRYERRVLSQVSNFFHVLVKLGIDASEETEDEPLAEGLDDGARGGNGKRSSAAADGPAHAEGKRKHKSQKPASEFVGGAPPPAAAAAVFTAASYPTRVLCLAAIVADMFQLSRHYVTVFTLHSNDLDYIARDFLRALSQHHLPKVKGAPIAYREGVRIRPVAASPATFADLVYTCVGDEECKALLRHAALRLDEEEVEQGGGGSSEGLLERRHIFNVDA